MRTVNVWPVALATLVVVAVVAFLYMRDRAIGCDTVDDGGKLHLSRNGVDTVRARFCYAADCKLIAEQMNKAERVRWHCE